MSGCQPASRSINVSRMMSERRSPVYSAASARNLVTSSADSRTVTYSECVPGAVNKGLPGVAWAASTSSSTTSWVKRRPLGSSTSSVARLTSGLMGVSVVILGGVRFLSTPSERDRIT